MAATDLAAPHPPFGHLLSARGEKEAQARLSGEDRLIIEELGENALLLKLGDRIDAALNRRAQELARVLREERLPGLIDVVPAFASVTLHFEPGVKLPRSRARALAIAALASDESLSGPTSTGSRVVTLSVSYGGDDGIDLESVARFANLDVAEVVARHLAQEYEVAMIGFLPGFAYLLGLDPSLAMPRHATPRAVVPAGSVAIGGAQTGIYPSAAPGGWRLIGRTVARLFDPAAPNPCLLAPGDRVRFRSC
ncbi:MAG: 5-oxoprolinase subunit PxpB [Lysobacterales bacterium]